jgi:hypothetical protein
MEELNLDCPRIREVLSWIDDVEWGEIVSDPLFKESRWDPIAMYDKLMGECRKDCAGNSGSIP